jgi:hypothetical protein
MFDRINCGNNFHSGNGLACTKGAGGMKGDARAVMELALEVLINLGLCGGDGNLELAMRNGGNKPGWETVQKIRKIFDRCRKLMAAIVFRMLKHFSRLEIL